MHARCAQSGSRGVQPMPRACTASRQVSAPGRIASDRVEEDGESLHIRLYADQARGTDAREDARLVHWFGGWAAINGAVRRARRTATTGIWIAASRSAAKAASTRSNVATATRSGYALVLERLTYREGNVPVSSSPSSTAADGRSPIRGRIQRRRGSGINLGWAQVGLDRKDAAAVAK